MVDYRKLVRDNIYFESSRGSLSPQDLWNLSTAELRRMARVYYSSLKEYNDEDNLFLDLDAEDQSLLQKKTKEQELITLKFEAVKDVLKTKIEEQQAKKNAKEKAAELQRLTGLLHQKRDEELSNKSVAELEEMIAGLKA